MGMARSRRRRRTRRTHRRCRGPPVNRYHRPTVAANDTGSATVEIAILAPLLVGIMLFLVACGKVVSSQLDVTAAAAAAARAASLQRTPTAAHTAADTAAVEALRGAEVTCHNRTIDADTATAEPATAATVTITCSVPLSDLLLLAVPGTRTVQASATSPVDTWRGQP
ncbi:MAG: TadE/TadG family type IV pilus assembly protein [Stackebrandtia sp.]